MLLHEQHGGDHDVALLDVPATALQRIRIVPPVRRGVQLERQSGNVLHARPFPRAPRRRQDAGPW